LKDLSRLGRDLKRTVLVDCKPLAFWSDPQNGIPINEYQGSSLGDQELGVVAAFLKELETVDDVRTVLDRKYMIRDSLRESNLL
jgi:RNA polymerase II subunit A small phosphatase-like protein